MMMLLQKQPYRAEPQQQKSEVSAVNAIYFWPYVRQERITTYAIHARHEYRSVGIHKQEQVGE